MSPPGRNARLHGLTRAVATADTRIFSVPVWYTCGNAGSVGELRSAGGVTEPGCCARATAIVTAARMEATATIGPRAATSRRGLIQRIRSLLSRAEVTVPAPCGTPVGSPWPLASGLAADDPNRFQSIDLDRVGLTHGHAVALQKKRDQIDVARHAKA